MQDPEQQRADYVNSCKYRRKKNIIEKKGDDGRWHKEVQFSYINGAKRYVRENNLRSYND
jgi:hypothetical protein